jgi:hypothetical protein
LHGFGPVPSTACCMTGGVGVLVTPSGVEVLVGTGG